MADELEIKGEDLLLFPHLFHIGNAGTHITTVLRLWNYFQEHPEKVEELKRAVARFLRDRMNVAGERQKDCMAELKFYRETYKDLLQVDEP